MSDLTRPDVEAELRSVESQLDDLVRRRARLLQHLVAPTPADPGLPGGRGAAPRSVGPGGGGGSVQQVLLVTGAVLLGLAGLVFAAVAWALVGPAGRFAILLGLGVVLGATSGALRTRLVAAASAVAAVGASFVATAWYAAPYLWGAGWAGTALASWTAVVSLLLAVAYAGLARATGLTGWRAAVGAVGSVGVVAAGVAMADSVSDTLGYTLTTALLALGVTALGRWVRLGAAGAVVAAVAASTSLLSLAAWGLEPERYLAYAGALLAWSVVAAVAGRIAPRGPLGDTLAALSSSAATGLAAAALSLVVGAAPWGAPSIAVVALAAVVGALTAWSRLVPVAPALVAVGVMALGSLLVPSVLGAPADVARWTAWLVVVAAGAATAGASPRRPSTIAVRGVCWAVAGAAGALAWLVVLDDLVADAPVERAAAPAGILLVLAGVGWSLSSRRVSGHRLSSAAYALPGLLVTLVPGALVALVQLWEQGWDAGWTEGLTRTVVYTAVGAALMALGARLRTAALLAAGLVVVAICAVAHLGVAAQQVPQWVVLAGAGAGLLAVGARWEWLRGRVHRAAAWVGELR